jgi:(p)ppGpp synthase/HD superfamily hydrolase
MTAISPRYTNALEYAREAHAKQVRKGTTIPYLAHLLGVSSLVLDYGGDEDQAIAALLHDVVEDQGEHHLSIVQEKFGERVARIVAACTDGSQAEKAAAQTIEEKHANWELRKQRYLEHLADEADDVLLVSGCDKLHNARAVLSDLRDPQVGRSVFERFTGRQEGTLWYYRSLADLFTHRGAPMARELASVVAALEAESFAPKHALNSTAALTITSGKSPE